MMVKVSGFFLPKKNRLPLCFLGLCSSILLWTCLVQLVAVGKLWHPQLSKGWHACFSFNSVSNHLTNVTFPHSSLPPPSLPSLPPAKLPEYERPRIYKSNGYLKVTCNGGLNQMRAAICDMVTVARYLNLTLLVPELDKHSFWGDSSSFDDIFDAKHFINSLRDEVRIIEGLPSKLTDSSDGNVLAMHPVSWSNEMYYKQQILPLFRKYKMIHFNRTDARLANNALPTELQKLRCRVNFQALKFNQQIEQLGRKLVNILRKKGTFVALHLRYEMDMLAFTGCTHGCSENEADELKKMRYAYPRWREKEIVSEQKRLEGLCPLTPEETALVLRALGFKKETQVYIASGETYGSELRLAVLRSAFPRIVRKEMLLEPEDLKHFRNHSSQMAALDYIVSLASDIFIPTFNGNMAKLVEGHRRYLGFRKTIVLDRKKLVQLLDMHQTGTLSWNQFAFHVQEAHKQRSGQPVCRRVIPDKPKEEHYFYANPQECFCSTSNRVFFDNTCKACI